MDWFEERVRGHPAWVILIEAFIGLGWLRAAVEKIISSDWWSGDVIREFVHEHEALTLPWYAGFLDGAVLPSTDVLAVVIVLAQLLTAASLLSGIALPTGLFVGMTMNINFIMAGAVDPSIFYLILQASIALWLFEARRSTPGRVAYLRWILRLAVLLVLVSAPFVSTIDPSSVVEDPAMVLATYGASIGLASFVALRRIDPRSAETVPFEATGGGSA